MSATPEKRGTAHWVSCPRCRGWFPVGHTLLERAAGTGQPGAIALHCPHCHTEFATREAARIVEGG